MARDWLETQNQASFKGVPFEVETDQVSSGRRLAIHEYPNSENWDNEQLGRKAFRITVDAYVYGDDVDTQAQTLLAACTSPDPGLLTLPLRAQTTADCDNVESTFEADALGRIRFRLEFVASSRQQGGLVPTGQLANEVAGAADDGSDAVTQDFSQDFNSEWRSFSQPVEVPSIARDSSADTITLAAEALSTVFQCVNISNTDAAAQVCFGIRQLKDNALEYAQQGATAIRIDGLVFIDTQDDTSSAFARIFADTLRLMAANADDPAIMAAALFPLTTFQPQTLPNDDLTVLTVRAETALIGEVAQFVRRIALIRWAHALTQVSYVARVDAVNAKAQIAPAFEPEIAAADSEVIANALKKVKSTAVSYLANNGAQLPRLLTIDLSRGMPAAVIAAMLYDDASRDEELWRRNGVENHPLSLPPTIDALAPTNG